MREELRTEGTTSKEKATLKYIGRLIAEQPVAEPVLQQRRNVIRSILSDATEAHQLLHLQMK
jgi:hypothetical protein